MFLSSMAEGMEGLPRSLSSAIFPYYLESRQVGIIIQVTMMVLMIL